MEQALDSQAESVRYDLVIQRSMIPAHKYAAEKGATNDPRDEIVPQKSE